MSRDSTPLTAWGPPRQRLRDFAERSTADLVAATAHTVLSGTIKGGTIKDQRHILRFKVSGTGAHATGGNLTSCVIKVGTTTVATSGAIYCVVDQGGSGIDTPWIFEGEFGITPVGSSGEIVGMLVTTTPGISPNAGAAPVAVQVNRASNIAFDTTADITVTVILTTAAGVTIEVLTGSLELLLH